MSKLSGELKPVNSSNIKEVGHDEKTKELRIKFHGDSVYAYDNVPKELFEKFMNAESKGSFFHKEIRKGGFKFRRIK